MPLSRTSPEGMPRGNVSGAGHTWGMATSSNTPTKVGDLRLQERERRREIVRDAAGAASLSYALTMPPPFTARLPRGARNLYQDCGVADTKRRPQWRGERKAVLVRLPVEVARQLTKVAETSHLSVSEAAGRLISAGLASSRIGGGPK